MVKKSAGKFLALLFTAVFVFSVAGCGSQRTLHENGHGAGNGEQADFSADPNTEDWQEAEEDIKTGEDNGTGEITETPGSVNDRESWNQFFQKTFYQVFSDAGNTNRIYSPVNLYLSLAMLSEISEGDTRTQITNLLGQDHQKKIRRQSKNLYFETNHVVTCRVGELDAKHDYMCAVGNSLWLDEKFPYQEKWMKQIEKSYYADCCLGEMGTDGMDKKIQAWVNKMTGGKLKEQAGEIRTNVNTVMMMLSSINFESGWKKPFSKKQTKKGTFHGVRDAASSASGEEETEDVRCDFLHSIITARVVKTDQHMAVELPMQNGVSMHIILPNEGISLMDLLKKEKGDLLPLCVGYNDNTENACIDLSVPKMTIDSTYDLKGILKEMGIADMFQSNKADFSPLIDSDADYHAGGIYVGKMSQTSNMTVDEKGCSVASYTRTVLEEKALLPEEQYKMKCDRPFLFMITKNSTYGGSDTELPLFAGVIHHLEERM